MEKVIEQPKADHFARWIGQAERIVIVTHQSPDGDAIGSSLALRHFLAGRGKQAHVVVPNGFPDFLRWMPGVQDIIQYDRHTEFGDRLIHEADVICCLDFNALQRIGAMEKLVQSAHTRKILIDHHLNPEQFCRIVISHPEISSTSELVFRLICALGCYDEITKECAECIYAGMMTDTGGFTFNSNNRDIYFIIGELLKKGIDKDAIYRRVYNTYSESRLRLLGYILREMTVYPGGHASLITLSVAEQRNFDYKRGDSEGFVNIPLQISGMVLSCFLREDTERPVIKVSLRSIGTFPCNKMAEEFFGGGGHLNAAGGEVHGTMEEARKIYEQALAKYSTFLGGKVLAQHLAGIRQ